MKSCIEAIMPGDTIVVAMTGHHFKFPDTLKTSERHYYVVDVCLRGPVIISEVSRGRIVMAGNYQSAIIRILKQ